MKRIIFIIAILVVCFTVPTWGIEIAFNGNKVQTDVDPYISNGYTYIPLRSFSNSFGINVNYIPDTKQIYLTKDSKTYTMQIGEKYLREKENNDIKSFRLPAAPEIKNGYTMLPVQVIGYIFDCNIYYNSDTKNISILTKDYTPPTTSVTAQSTDAAKTKITYILNTNSKRFHRPDCGSADTMKPQNRSETTKTREEVIAMGYKPCGNCQP